MNMLKRPKLFLSRAQADMTVEVGSSNEDKSKARYHVLSRRIPEKDIADERVKQGDELIVRSTRGSRRSQA